jgi:hypothetical protein
LAEDEEGENTMITREQAKRLVEVAQAIADGKRVTRLFNGNEMLSAAEDYGIGTGWEYTIHAPPPEPKWRPWTLEEAIDNIGRVVRWKNDVAAHLIVSVHTYDGDPMVAFGGVAGSLSVQNVAVCCQFLDGTPCGVRE